MAPKGDKLISKEKYLRTKGKTLIEEYNYFEDFLNSLNDQVITESVIRQIQLEINIFNPLLEKYSEFLVEWLAEDFTSDEFPSHSNFRRSYSNLKLRAETLLECNSTTATTASMNQSIHNISNDSTRSTQGVKLPVISLPTFDGLQQNFKSFFEVFEALINSNTNINPTEKFLYLKGCLKGNAKQIVDELKASEANYGIAIELLKERYDNKKFLIFSHFDSLLNIPKISKETQLRSYHDAFITHIRAIENENLTHAEYKDAVLAYITKSKVDNHTAEEFAKLFPKKIPTTQDISKFLSERCNVIDEANSLTKAHSFEKRRVSESKNSTYSLVQSSSSCILCSNNHFLDKCPTFLALSSRDRFNKIRELKYCTICLRHNNGTKCTLNWTCKSCKQRHNNLLCLKNSSRSSNTNSAHGDNNLTSPTSTSDNTLASVSSEVSETPSTTMCGFSIASEVLLSTIQVKVTNGNKILTIRGLLDSGSQNNLISEELCEKLNLSYKSANVQLKGVSGIFLTCSKYASIQIQSKSGNFKANISCLIVPTITEKLPKVSLNKESLNIPSHISLADCSFYEPGSIDLLIGSSLFYQLLLPEKISLGKSMPILQNSQLGWIVSGDVPKNLIVLPPNTTVHTFSSICGHATTVANDPYLDLHQSLTKFWKLDDSKPTSKLSLLSPYERFCENQFLKTVSFDDSGHLLVHIPFNYKLKLLGESRQMATKRFLHLEKRLRGNADLSEKYSKFMNDYEKLGHMTRITDAENHNFDHSEIETADGCISIADIPPQFLPHHAVIKQSLTTKLRVVFDASARSSTGISVNDAQLVGPQVQDNLLDILLRFRSHEVAICGDIEKMYRMVNVHPKYRKFQCILWRNDPNEPISIFQLNTITYGTACASFLATRSLLHIADRNKNLFPDATELITNNFYMDDLLFSVHSIEDAIRLKNDITYILSSAGLTIRKVLSNKLEVTNSSSDTNVDFATIPLGERSDSKTLGLHWNSETDNLFCKVEIPIDNEIPTKRNLLSIVSKVFDPLGLFSPLTIQGKIMIQILWKSGIDWDDFIPIDLIAKWNAFKSQLSTLDNVTVARCLIPYQCTDIQLHGFSDASMVAYGCCFYLRCRTSSGNIMSNLVLSKSRITPLRPVSIPRLELCAAVMLSEWCHKLAKIFSIPSNNIFLWTDSKITLSWIKSVPNKYKTFVANRIATIQELTNLDNWHHVSTINNPADLISRGLDITALKNCHFWFNGPNFLLQDEIHFNDNYKPDQNEIMETKGSITTFTMSSDHLFVNSLFENYSTLTKLQRVVAYVLRFAKNCKGTERVAGVLTAIELKTSLKILTRLCQHTSFVKEIETVKSGNDVKNSRIRSLNPFLDDEDCLRVGGRLSYSSFSFEKKHPLLLPKGHKFTSLIIKKFHSELLHCGAQTLLAAIRESFWPIGGLNYIKTIIRKCTSCVKNKPIIRHPLMSDLPKQRVIPTYPFHNVGIDYAGPIAIKDGTARSSRLVKAYICVFVCMVTSAMHLELLTDLSTNAFLSTLKRFIARRGIPASISSDNATNFRGAKSKLDSLFGILHNPESQSQILNYLHSKSIQWNFINPRAPHEGGLWESSVKSVKLHLRRILGNANLSFENMYTTLTMIEAVLNSRPLSYISSEPEDLIPLTPGHFLIGRPLTSIPEPSLLSVRQNRLSVYQRAQQMTHHFWKRWSREVVPKFQQRMKWFQHLPDLLKLNTVVLLQEDNIPPLQWPIGRVVQLHPSVDNVLRAVSVKLANGNIVRRSVHRLCALPED